MDPNNHESDANCEVEFYKAIVCKLGERKVYHSDIGKPMSTACDKKRINFVALDFDQTLVEIHTQGRWAGPVELLERRIRPIFRALIPHLHKSGIHLAVVTFSQQVALISRVMRTAFPDIADQIPIRGEDQSWEYCGAVEELLSRAPKGTIIERQTTLLVDDDVNNVKAAILEGTWAVWCNPKNLHSLADDLLAL